MNSMKRPLISVIIPVYNVAKFLQQSIESVLNQDYDNYEVILVDDGSTDDSPRLCDNFAALNKKVKVIHKDNAGQGEARNSGMDVASGQYIYFMDSDDTIQTNTLSTFVDFVIANGDFDIVGTDYQYTKEDNRMMPVKITGHDEIFNDAQDVQNRFLRRTLVILAPATFYNISWMKQNGLRFKDIPYSEDQLFIWEALAKARRVGFIHKTLYNYLRHAGSIMTASRFDKIVASYPYFKALQERFSKEENLDPETRKFMLSRWLVGIFHSASKLCSYKEYAELLKRCEGCSNIKKAQKFPDIKVKLLTIPYMINSRLYYCINRLI